MPLPVDMAWIEEWWIKLSLANLLFAVIIYPFSGSIKKAFSFDLTSPIQSLDESEPSFINKLSIFYFLGKKQAAPYP